MTSLLKNKAADIALALFIAVASASSAPFWWQYVPYVHHHSANPTPSPSSTYGVISFSGGCAPYQVYAQNRWAPYGTAVRTEPNVLARQISAFDGNHSIAVNGWVHSSVPYPTNTPPWNSDVWFHLADGTGWVSFSGVRATPTAQDPTGYADGGTPAPTPATCQGSAQ